MPVIISHVLHTCHITHGKEVAIEANKLTELHGSAKTVGRSKINRVKPGSERGPAKKTEPGMCVQGCLCAPRAESGHES